MRAIKFRAWQSYERRMYPVTSLDFGYGGEATTVIATPPGVFYNPLVHGENAVLMQYTGLKDRAGQEIYEGDIVQWEAFNGIHQRVVEWIEDRAQFLPNNMQEGVLVIGNRYEHPHLSLERHP